ncbi:MAG: ABC transporter permease [Myxococcota bacterium]|nr:ABC transporter permease [Myxococcota bacterium]
MAVLITFVKKEFKIIIRNPSGLMILFILPAILIIVLSVALQGTFTISAENQKLDVLIPNEVQQSVSGWTVFALFWIAQMVAISILNEHKSSVYKRIVLSPVTMAAYLVGKIVPFIGINALQAALLFAIGIHVLPLFGCRGLTVPHYGALVITTLAISMAANGLGVMMAFFSRTDRFAGAVNVALLILMSVMGGIVIPRFALPAYMQQLTLAVPHGWAIQIYQDILIRKHDIGQILPEVGVLLLFAVGFFFLGTVKMFAGNRA